jgi:hypothetical protein
VVDGQRAPVGVVVVAVGVVVMRRHRLELELGTADNERFCDELKL